MAKVTFNKAKFTEKIRGLLDNAPYERIGRTVIESIKTSVRKGISPATGRAFEELKESTIDRRRKLSRINRTSKAFREAKSNLTFSGQLLNALTFNIFTNGSSTIINIFTNPTNRRKYRGLRGGLLDAPDNAELQLEMETGNPGLNRPPRPYVGIDKNTNKEVKTILETHIRTELDKINKS